MIQFVLLFPLGTFPNAFHIPAVMFKRIQRSTGDMVLRLVGELIHGKSPVKSVSFARRTADTAA
jgi:hypothetical protein